MTLKKTEKGVIYNANTGKFREVTDEEREKALERARRNSNRGEVEGADWGDADPVLLSKALCCVTVYGFAIRLGYTRDGGAFSIAVISDEKLPTKYVRPSEGIDEYLQFLINTYARD